MTKTIAVAGKGGTGKTTVTSLLIKYLVENRSGAVLAIDADPSTNLNLTLGVPLYETVGDIREETLQEVQSGGSLSGMGRPEGPGCYCAANNMLRLTIDRLSKSYDYVVIDNEAGLEHLSRRTTRDVDLLLTVSDPTMRGIIAAGRAAKLIGELKTRVGDIGLIVNRVPTDGSGEPKLTPELEQAIAENGLKLVGLLPEDPTVGEYDAKGLPLVELPPESPARQAVEEIIKSLDGL